MMPPPLKANNPSEPGNDQRPPPPKQASWLATLYVLFFRPSLIFGVLERETLPRTLMRAAAMTLLCALALTLVDIPLTSRNVDEWADWLATEMRDLELVDGQLSWNPAQPLPYSRHFNHWRVNFVGDPDAGFNPDERHGPETKGIWISPTAVYYWRKVQRDRIVARQVLDTGKLFGAFKMKGDGDDADGGVAVAFDGRNRALVRSAVVAMSALANLATVIGEVVFYAALFTLIPLLLRSPQARMGVKKMLIFHLHVAWVPLIVATVYAMTRIPVLQFNTVFAVGYLVYFSLVVIVARQKLRELQNQEGNL